MDKNVVHLVGRALWFVCGLTALCVGLGALGINLQSLLHLDSMDFVLRGIVGLCGVGSLAMFFMDCSGKCST